MIIDTHAHLMFEQFDGEIGPILERAKAAGVGKIINIACDLKGAKQAVALADAHEDLYATVGLHPYGAGAINGEMLAKFGGWIADNEKVVAIGECGLDYAKCEVPPEDQKKAFRMQLDLASELEVPVVVHNREADEDTLTILQEFPDVKVVFHCFGSDLAFAQRVWDLGYVTSFTGIVTYPNAGELRAVVKEVPMDKFFVETDCPYLAPQAHRGERNEPAFVVEVVKEIAKVKSLSAEEVVKASTENAVGFFGL